MATNVAEALNIEKARAAALPQASYEPPPEEAPKKKSILGALAPLSKVHAKINPAYKAVMEAGFGKEKYQGFINPQEKSVYGASAFETQQGRPGSGTNPLFDKYRGMV